MYNIYTRQVIQISSLSVYEGNIPIDEVRRTHNRILTKVASIRKNDTALSRGIPPHPSSTAGTAPLRPQARAVNQQRIPARPQANAANQQRIPARPQANVVNQQRIPARPQANAVNQQRIPARPQANVANQQRIPARPQAGAVNQQRIPARPQMRTVAGTGAVKQMPADKYDKAHNPFSSGIDHRKEPKGIWDDILIRQSANGTGYGRIPEFSTDIDNIIELEPLDDPPPRIRDVSIGSDKIILSGSGPIVESISSKEDLKQLKKSAKQRTTTAVKKRKPEIRTDTAGDTGDSQKIEEAAAADTGQTVTTIPPKIRFSISVKLVTIVAILLLLSLGAITALVSILVSADVKLTAEDNNFSINRRTSEAVQTGLHGINSAVTVFFYDIESIRYNISSNTQDVEDAAARYFFEQNDQITAMLTDDGSYFVNETFFKEKGGDRNMPKSWSTTAGADIKEAAFGVILLRNATPFFGAPTIVMRMPVNNSMVEVFFSSETLNLLLGGGNNISYLLNEEGDVLLHPNIDVLLGGLNFSNIPFVKNILENSNSRIQNVYTDENGNEYFGAVQRLNIGSTVLLTIIRASVVFGGIVETTTRNIILSIVVLIMSIVFIVLFSQTISRPIQSLTNAVTKMEEGDYNLNLTYNSNDELGVLTQNFIGMGNSLENFEKFTNKAIVKLAKQGKLSRSGVNKKATICFALIRDFHEIADGLDAVSIVDFVNEYLRFMVPCVAENGGNVDKFLTQGGVIIMALWGTPETAGSSEKDALNCICAALSMRAALCCLNKNRIRKFGNQMPLIKLGCGINTGDVVAGQIGSEKRMEYTVIGDAVNLAARIEGPNDLFDTDILISEETYRYVSDYLITKEMQSIEVKGKEKPLRIYSVINIRDPMITSSMLERLQKLPGIDIDICKQCIGPDGPRSLEEVRSRWRAK
ncbi:MAG: HAMP domain-containing protein [Treponema sp.]|nr:HAMP domain-containing protein [Treponema sp.]